MYSIAFLPGRVPVAFSHVFIVKHPPLLSQNSFPSKKVETSVPACSYCVVPHDLARSQHKWMFTEAIKLWHQIFYSILSISKKAKWLLNFSRCTHVSLIRKFSHAKYSLTIPLTKMVTFLKTLQNSMWVKECSVRVIKSTTLGISV